VVTQLSLALGRMGTIGETLPPSSLFRTFVRVCKSGCVPRSVQCICCRLTKLRLTTWLIVDSTNAVLIVSPLPIPLTIVRDGLLIVANVSLELCHTNRQFLRWCGGHPTEVDEQSGQALEGFLRRSRATVGGASSTPRHLSLAAVLQAPWSAAVRPSAASEVIPVDYMFAVGMQILPYLPDVFAPSERNTTCWFSCIPGAALAR